ncbi:hypothetical protein BDK92_4569 [Micromonospora pisi]|uniref:Uncharacterized protein n=1 Tax=Micromonospora pisi TaxID=589240 RepID=A0A495JN04_9ACTN|nr:hypothetical protein [Micromonospora pisi]RKR90201.1 hypothetical protein BDK92_4569 [Micromonospora pisi]
MSWRRTTILCAVVACGSLLAGCGTTPSPGPDTESRGTATSTGTSGAGTSGAGANSTTGPGSGQPAAGAPTAGPCPAGADYPAGTDHEAREVPGGGPGTTLWALLFLTTDELTADRDTKIVWRMTGTGDLTMRATGPAGAEVTPIWGPTGHSGSNWKRPGDEWGTGWHFPTPGCWTVHASRAGGDAAQLVLRVAPA